MQLLYVGRLDPEKGIQSLLFAIEKMIEQKIQFHIHIYGKGKYNNTINEISSQYPLHITSHGRKNKKEIIGQRKKCDFFIMPSTFLETFGLTACESLLCGVPVIGNKKGGLIPFIDKELDIQQSKGKHDGERLYNLLRSLVSENKSKKDYQQLILRTKETYNKNQWIKRIKGIVPLSQKILMISDFINYNGGGIETHIHDASALLKQQHHKTIIYGHDAPHGKLSTLIKLIGMVGSLFNIKDSIYINKITKKERIGLIWWHSISRVIGWLPVRNSNQTMNQIITHHELGLFHPFPSKTTREDQIPHARSLSSFVQAGQTNNIFKKIAIVGKYIMIRLIHKQLQRKVKIHIVPSAWMIPMVKAWHPHSTVIEIGHFVDIE